MKMVNDAGGHERPQDQLHHLWTTATIAAEGRGNASASWSRRTRSCCVFNPLGTPIQHGDPRAIMNQQQGAAALRRHGRVEVGQARGSSPGPWAGSPTTHTEGVDLCQAHPVDQRQGRQDRRADAERRLRQGLLATASSRASARPPTSARSSSTSTYEVTDPTVDSQMIQLKNSGADVFFNITTPKFAAQAIKQGGRDRLEAGPLSQQRLLVLRFGAEAGRHRELAGHHSRALPQGCE